MDLYLQLLRAERMTDRFRFEGDGRMFVFWSRVYYFLRQKVREEDQRTWGQYTQ